MLIFQAIVAGIVYYKLLKSKDTISAVRIFSLVSLLCCFYPFIRYSCMTTADYRMMYIWDSNGRDYINTDLYINDLSIIKIMTMSIKRNIKTILKLLQRKKVTKADIVLLSPNQRLVRKKVIITGGNRGLGFAMAKNLQMKEPKS